MSFPLRVTEVRYTPATSVETAAGLLGYIACVMNDALRLDGLTLRLTRARRLAVSYPAHRTRHGVDHPIVRPASEGVRLDLERQILDHLGVLVEVRDE